LRLFSKYSPSAVLVAVEMAEMDGGEVARRIRAIPGGRGAPFIAMADMTDAGAAEAARQAGISEYVAKPVRVDDVLGVLARVLSITYLRKIRVVTDGENATPKSIKPEILVGLSAADMRSARQAIEEGDMARLREQIAGMKEIRPEIVEKLLLAVNQYDYETLYQAFGHEGDASDG